MELGLLVVDPVVLVVVLVELLDLIFLEREFIILSCFFLVLFKVT